LSEGAAKTSVAGVALDKKLLLEKDCPLLQLEADVSGISEQSVLLKLEPHAPAHKR
jgi:hypothetical protein